MQTKYITPEDVAKIASKLSGHSRTIWLLMCDTGLRISDAVALRYSDIDKEGKIHYKAKKTGKIGIASPSGNVLALLGRKKTREYIFRSSVNPNKHIHRSTVFKHIKRACALCGIDAHGIAPHTARKVFAVKDFRENGLGKTMHDLQHSSAATTLFYALSDDPIPMIFRELNALREQIEELYELCDFICEKIGFDNEKPINVRTSEQKKGP